MVGSMIENPYRVKAGTIIPWPVSTLPKGWLLCDGSAISRTTYKSLFSVIGTTYGTGDGSTTFNLPNGRIPVALNLPAKGSGKALGLTNGQGNFGTYTSNASSSSFSLGVNSALYNTDIGTNNTASMQGWTNAKTFGVVSDSAKSGITTDISNQKRAIIKY